MTLMVPEKKYYTIKLTSYFFYFFMEEVFEDEYLTYLYILKIAVNFKLTVCEKLHDTTSRNLSQS